MSATRHPNSSQWREKLTGLVTSWQNLVTSGFLTPNWKSIIPKKSLQGVITTFLSYHLGSGASADLKLLTGSDAVFQVVSSPSELCFQNQYLKCVQKLTGIKSRPRVQVLRSFSDAQLTLETSCNSLRCNLLENAFQISNCRSKGNEEGKDLLLLQQPWDCTGGRSSQLPLSNLGQQKSSSTL